MAFSIAIKSYDHDNEMFIMGSVLGLGPVALEVGELDLLLAKLSRSRRVKNQLRPAPAAWMPTGHSAQCSTSCRGLQGVLFEDQEAEDVEDVEA